MRLASFAFGFFCVWLLSRFASFAFCNFCVSQLSRFASFAFRFFRVSLLSRFATFAFRNFSVSLLLRFASFVFFFFAFPFFRVLLIVSSVTFAFSFFRIPLLTTFRRCSFSPACSLFSGAAALLQKLFFPFFSLLVFGLGHPPGHFENFLIIFLQPQFDMCLVLIICSECIFFKLQHLLWLLAPTSSSPPFPTGSCCSNTNVLEPGSDALSSTFQVYCHLNDFRCTIQAHNNVHRQSTVLGGSITVPQQYLECLTRSASRISSPNRLDEKSWSW